MREVYDRAKAQADTDNTEPKACKGKAGAALLRLRQQFPEEEAESCFSLRDFFREAIRPRSRAYMEQILGCMELKRKIAALRDGLTAEGRGEKEAKAAAGIAQNGSVAEWKGSTESRMQEELERLEWQLKQEERRLCEQLPKGDPYLTSIYLDSNEDELLRRGILFTGGTPYSEVEELFRSCNAVTEQERSMLMLGDRAARELPSPLIVEVYLHAVCKVFPDGSVQMVRN